MATRSTLLRVQREAAEAAKGGANMLGAMDDARFQTRCDQLIDEVRAHIAEFKAERPDVDQRQVVESWLIQKVSLLQLQVERHAAEIAALKRQ